mmetsp:Transcript_35289/g.110281  ORF Transcript_35289/g.110281 Transcript_35289/m.110281 type:complete len:242 (+) Transcript_35289:1582-2307(+)
MSGILSWNPIAITRPLPSSWRAVATITSIRSSACIIVIAVPVRGDGCRRAGSPALEAFVPGSINLGRALRTDPVSRPTGVKRWVDVIRTSSERDSTIPVAHPSRLWGAALVALSSRREDIGEAVRTGPISVTTSKFASGVLVVSLGARSLWFRGATLVADHLAGKHIGTAARALPVPWARDLKRRARVFRGGSAGTSTATFSRARSSALVAFPLRCEHSGKTPRAGPVTSKLARGQRHLVC